MVCLVVPYLFKFFKGCLPEILPCPFLSTFNQMMFYIFIIRGNSHVQPLNHQIGDEDSLYEFDDDCYKEDGQDLPFVSYTELVPENQIAMADKHSNDEKVFRASDHQTRTFKQQPFQTMYQPRKPFSSTYNSSGFSRVNHFLGNKNSRAQNSFHCCESAYSNKENRDPENNLFEESLDAYEVIGDRTVPQFKQRKYSSKHTSQKLSEIFSQNLHEEKYEISDEDEDLPDMPQVNPLNKQHTPADVGYQSFALTTVNKLRPPQYDVDKMAEISKNVTRSFNRTTFKCSSQSNVSNQNENNLKDLNRNVAQIYSNLLEKGAGLSKRKFTNEDTSSKGPTFIQNHNKIAKPNIVFQEDTFHTGNYLRSVTIPNIPENSQTYNNQQEIFVNSSKAPSIKQDETQLIGNRVHENELLQNCTTYLPTQTLGKKRSKMNNSDATNQNNDWQSSIFTGSHSKEDYGFQDGHEVMRSAILFFSFNTSDLVHFTKLY